MCLKGVSEVGKQDATHRCAKCKAYSGNKGHLCKPEKLKKPRTDKQGKAGKKGKKGKGAKKGASAKASKKKAKKSGK